MFLAEKPRSVPVFPPPNRYHILSNPFDTALSSRLLAHLPVPASSSASAHLSWLSRTCELLSLTMSDATSLLLHHTSSLNPSPFLDSTSLSILDSCNSIFAFSDRLLHRILFLRFSLKSHKSMPVVVEKKELPRLRAIGSLPSMEKSPRGEIVPVQNAICAVEAVSALVIGAIGVALSGGKGKEYFEGLKVDAEIFAWGEEFNKVLEAASKRTGEGSVEEELEKMEATIRALTAGMNLDGMEKKMAMEEMERACEEMRARLETLKDSMDAVFHAALYARNAAVQSSLVHAQTRCK